MKLAFEEQDGIFTHIYDTDNYFKVIPSNPSHQPLHINLQKVLSKKRLSLLIY